MHLPAGLVNAMTLRLLTRVRVLTQFLTLTGRRRRGVGRVNSLYPDIAQFWRGRGVGRKGPTQGAQSRGWFVLNAQPVCGLYWPAFTSLNSVLHSIFTSSASLLATENTWGGLGRGGGR